MSNLAIYGKKLLVIGGNSYLSAMISNAACSLGAKVTAVTRSGINRDKKINSNIHFVAGEATNPATFEQHLRENDVVINSFGVMSDLLGNKMHRQTGEGICESLNRNSAREIGKFLGKIGGKKMVNLSIMKDSFVTKQTEDTLFQHENLRMCLIRLGFVNLLNDSKHFKAGGINKTHNPNLKKALQEFAKNNPFASEALKLNVFDNCHDVNTIVEASIYTAFSPKYDGKIIESKDIAKIIQEKQYLEKSENQERRRDSGASEQATI